MSSLLDISSVEMPRAGEAEPAVAGEARRHRDDQHRSIRLLEHGAQRVVEPARLVRVVRPRGPDEQPADEADRAALRDVADLADQHVGPAGVTGLALGLEVLPEPLTDPAPH